MTTTVRIFNESAHEGAKNLRVHRVFFSNEGTHAEDGVIIEPGGSHAFAIRLNVRLAIEEEYDVIITNTTREENE